ENRNTRNGDSVRRSWRGDDATEREDGDVRIEGLRRNGYSCTKPFVKHDEPRCRGLWHVLHEHRRRQVHIQRRASAQHGMDATHSLLRSTCSTTSTPCAATCVRRRGSRESSPKVAPHPTSYRIEPSPT